KIAFDCDARSHFRFSFVQLPTTPGNLELQITTMVSRRETQDRETQRFQQDSSQDDKDETHCENVEPGWLVDVNSVAYHLTREEGRKDHDWYDNGPRSSSTAVCWSFKTLHHGLGTSGKLTVYLSYKRYRDVSAPEMSPQPVKLAWLDSKV